MSDETKKLIRETIDNLKEMDEESLRILKAGSEMLKTRDSMDRKDEKKAG